MTTRNRSLLMGRVTMEFVLLNLSLIIVLLGVLPRNNMIVVAPEHIGMIILLANLTWGAILGINTDLSAYILKAEERKRIKNLVVNAVVWVGFTFFIATLIGMEEISPATLLLPIALFLVLDLLLLRVFNHLLFRRKLSSGPQVMVFGQPQNEQLLDMLSTSLYKQGFRLWSSPEFRGPSTIANPAEQLSITLETEPIDEVFIFLGELPEAMVEQIIRTADYHGVRVNLIPSAPTSVTHKVSVRQRPLDLSILQLRHSPLDSGDNYLLKRGFDIFFALLVITLLSPLLLLIATLIYLDNPGPIFYKPIRRGERGNPFTCYKFRTMRECDDPVNGVKSTQRNDPRITRIGKFLRKYDLDELPQFFNVLRGEMSVVGPRPHRTFLHNDFRKIVNDYMVRHYVKPGVTGWAQVNGWRGLATTDEHKRQRVYHDLWYIENWSLWLDIKIIFLTVFGRKTRNNAF